RPAYPVPNALDPRAVDRSSMPIPRRCPKCDAPLPTPNEAAAGPIRCQSCQAELAAESGPSSGVGRGGYESANPSARRPTRRALRLVGVLGIGAVLAALAACLYFGWSTPTEFTDPDGVFTARFPNRPTVKAVAEAQPLLLRWGERLYRTNVLWEEYS